MEWGVGSGLLEGWWLPLSLRCPRGLQPASPLCRQLAEVIRARYLSGPEKARRHGVLADFFSGAWSQGTKKLITLPLVGKPLSLDRKVGAGPAAHPRLAMPAGLTSFSRLSPLSVPLTSFSSLAIECELPPP